LKKKNKFNFFSKIFLKYKNKQVVQLVIRGENGNPGEKKA
jgi:hypothetical protein